MHKQNLFFILFLVCQQSFAADLKFRGDLFFSTTRTGIKTNQKLNTGNRVLEQSEQLSILELRPDFKWQVTEEHFFVLRSSHDYSYGTIPLQSPAETKTLSQGRSDLTDFYFSSDWGAVLTTVVGLQNYQWGPGEFYSPTNPFFHFQPDQKKFFFKEKGKVLARANLSLSDRVGIVLITEFMDNNEAKWMAEENFDSKSVIKLDFQMENPSNSVSLLYGQEDKHILFIGAYGAYSPVEGFSLYMDSKFSQGRKTFLPQKNTFGSYDMAKTDETAFYGTTLIGARYEDNFDLRQEFLFHEPGYTDQEWSNAKKSASTLSLNLLRNISRFYKPGLEFKRKTYSYTSLRVPNLGPKDEGTLYMRWMASLSENSQLAQLAYEHNLTETMVGSLEYSRSFGDEDTELNLLTDDQISAGLRYAF